MSIDSQIQMLRTVNVNHIDEQFILNLGLNNELTHEQPTEYESYFGKGLHIWQYPNQFASFVKSIFGTKVNSYMEIGVHKGGTFITMSEILARKNPNIKLYAVDIENINPILTEYKKYRNFEYIQIDSQHEDFINFCEHTPIDFVFIDGDHTFEGVQNDYIIFKHKFDTKHLVFHDIVNCVVPGVEQTWQMVKESGMFATEEFVQQYESVGGQSYLGIGHATRS
jgi:cephalosporin hydroxylase